MKDKLETRAWYKGLCQPLPRGTA